MGLVVEAAVDGNSGKTVLGSDKLGSADTDSDAHEVFDRAGFEDAVEDALEVPGREFGHFRELLDGQSFVVVGFNVGGHFGHLTVVSRKFGGVFDGAHDAGDPDDLALIILQ